MTLPPGTTLRTLTMHPDRRGWLFEAFRQEWVPDLPGAQVNVMWSRAGVMRGSHVHGRHADYFVLAQGKALVGLKDLRKRSPAYGLAAIVEMSADAPQALIVPPGVLHGMYFPTDSVLVTVESETYDPGEEVRCRWNDPELAIPWPFSEAVLSDSDRGAPSYADMMRRIEPWQAGFAV
jgi:dTDP-4-dehydrorhamnose 3,5-epimerase